MMGDGQEKEGEKAVNPSGICGDGGQSPSQGFAGEAEKGNCHPGGRREMGFIYFIETADGEYVKIGYSKNVQVRLSQLGTFRPSPFSFRIIGSLPGSLAVERWLHGLFAVDRDNGEWFRKSQRLKAFLEILDFSATVLGFYIAQEAAPRRRKNSIDNADKDKTAQSMVRKRWDKTTAEERSDYARKMNAARWGAKKKKRKTKTA